MNFVYILAGWEGSAHNSRIINSAKAKGFKAPTGKYYVTDTGYSNMPVTLTPYCSIWYYL